MSGARDLAVGLVLAALGVGMLAWLAADLAAGEAGLVAAVARTGSGLFWLSLAVVVLVERAGPAALVATVASVVLVLLSLALGLLLTPQDFTGTTSKAPDTPREARTLGVVLGVALLVGSAWLWRRWRRWGRARP